MNNDIEDLKKSLKEKFDISEEEFIDILDLAIEETDVYSTNIVKDSLRKDFTKPHYHFYTGVRLKSLGLKLLREMLKEENDIFGVEVSTKGKSNFKVFLALFHNTEREFCAKELMKETEKLAAFITASKERIISEGKGEDHG